MKFLPLILLLVFVSPIHVQAYEFPTTNISSIDVIHAGVDQSAQIEFTINTNCQCKDTIYYEIIVVAMATEEYQYQHSDRILVRKEHSLSIVLDPFISLDDIRGVSIYVRSEDSIENLISTWSHQLKAVEDQKIMLQVDMLQQASIPSKTRYVNSTKIDYYDQFLFRVGVMKESPVIQLANWSFFISSTVTSNAQVEGILSIDEGNESIRLKASSTTLGYQFYPLQLLNFRSDQSPGDNYLAHPIDILLDSDYRDQPVLHHSLQLSLSSRINYSITILIDHAIKYPLIGECDKAYWCIRQDHHTSDNQNSFSSWTLG